MAGASLGLVATTTLMTLRALPYEQRRLAAEMVGIPMAFGTVIVIQLVLR